MCAQWEETTTNGSLPLDPRQQNTPIIWLTITMTSVVVAIVVTVIIVSLCCWCYNRKKRASDLAALNNKGGLIVLSDELQHANTEGRLVVNASLLDNTMNCESNLYRSSKSECTREEALVTQKLTSDTPIPASMNSVPLTEDGYATLEPDNTLKDIVKDQPEEYSLPSKESTTGYDYLKEIVEKGINVEDHDYDEVYWEPANQEEELMDQLTKLGLLVIDSYNLEIKDQLGSGEFGIVSRGLWTVKRERGVNLDTEKPMEVAVKSLKQKASEVERVKFLQEAAIMGQFNHASILKVLGIVLGDQMKIVTEIMPKGDLQHHLISLRGSNECEELRAILLSYTRQIAMGVGYLSLKQYIHRDLAARNVLVSDECVCKIADFGLSRNLQNEDYYVSHGGKIPVKWTAPEALQYRKYSAASDVWSYGCLLYEIWSLGYKPFHDITNAQVIRTVDCGYRLPPPPGCPRKIYQIMIDCWNPTPTLRPKACDTLISLQQPDFRILKWSEEDLLTCDSEKATVIGSSIEEGYCLYKDLQKVYSSAVSAEDGPGGNDLNTVDSNKEVDTVN